MISPVNVTTLIISAPQKEDTILELNPGVKLEAKCNISAFITSVKNPNERIFIGSVTAIRNGRTFAFAKVSTKDAAGAAQGLVRFIPLNSKETM